MAGIIGPLAAGLLLILVPLPMLLFIDAASFLASMISLLFVKRSFNAEHRCEENCDKDRRRYSRRAALCAEPPALVLAHLVAAADQVYIADETEVQIVLYAKEWLHASDTQIGLLYASDGFGVVVFSLMANWLRKRWSFGVVALGSLTVLGLLTSVMVFTHWYALVLLIWALRGGIDILFLDQHLQLDPITDRSQCAPGARDHFHTSVDMDNCLTGSAARRPGNRRNWRCRLDLRAYRHAGFCRWRCFLLHTVRPR